MRRTRAAGEGGVRRVSRRTTGRGNRIGARSATHFIRRNRVLTGTDSRAAPSNKTPGPTRRRHRAFFTAEGTTGKRNDGPPSSKQARRDRHLSHLRSVPAILDRSTYPSAETAHIAPTAAYSNTISPFLATSGHAAFVRTARTIDPATPPTMTSIGKTAFLGSSVPAQ
ncbi:hypothetical protein Bcep18194_A5046 [Burkholderia lata]|uniref:Uncharacterized protein n=1 Tax=Burkholderia lata (strain ATCC 17760 / DSM 23089 / LMG 22485 / NCIMB 9086 / R18194 / 383) TaxID=482957 RepID=Q39FX6_BURL3|nr:hypothetical protein Bcep18194_A5046 [Burkholderia lata]